MTEIGPFSPLSSSFAAHAPKPGEQLAQAAALFAEHLKTGQPLSQEQRKEGNALLDGVHAHAERVAYEAAILAGQDVNTPLDTAYKHLEILDASLAETRAVADTMRPFFK